MYIPSLKYLSPFGFFCFTLALPLLAAERVALVIGNNAYKHGTPLVNCVNDAKAIADALKKTGFQVIIAEDASLEQMEAKSLEFRRAAQGAKAAWFHYSGHGAEVKGVNYLIPVDADVKEEFQVKHRAFAVDQILGAMEDAETPLKVVVLDCCRDNPFGRGWSRSGSAGLAQIGNTPSGTIIAFATSPGKVAADGEGSNSPYTTALVKAIATPGLDVKDVFNEAGRQVILATNKAQQPWVNSSFFDNFAMLNTVTGNGGGGAHLAPAPEMVPPSLHKTSSEDAAYLKALRERVNQGDAQAQNEIGMFYLSSRHGEVDYVAGVAWLTRAAQGGNPNAQNYLGSLYERGDCGLKQHFENAGQLYALAANQGHGPATLALARMINEGIGTNADPVKGWALATLASERGEEDANKLANEIAGQLDEKQREKARKELAIIKSAKPATPDQPKPADTKDTKDTKGTKGKK